MAVLLSARACLLLAAATLAATPAAAERITTYWQLEPTMPVGAQNAAFGKPLFAQRMLPVKLVKLTEAATPAGSTTATPAGTLLYLVVNASGKRGWCTIKDRSAGNQAKSLFIPVLDQRPCFADTDGDGRLDASFGVFDAYTTLSPPQTRGSIDAAKPMAVQAGYEAVDVHQFPVEMTVRYELRPGSAPAKTRLRVTVERPGHSDWVDVRGMADGEGGLLAALGTVVKVKSVTAADAQVELIVPPAIYIYAMNDGTVSVPELPAGVLP
ncbi:hypothetical protein [Sphingomonas sp.]|uniref:hypothetical protein n=1 Tax=Sphingomonas sp. TaxID=28214 RepID=UPI001B0D0162|nr:hypothetical protein [Sphingomonas sp.]MBO9715052.1 hypothetical protein [Sphingomonas sp.]